MVLELVKRDASVVVWRKDLAIEKSVGRDMLTRCGYRREVVGESVGSP